jgi:5-methylcytosine-specific restriction endonuclease McrA
MRIFNAVEFSFMTLEELISKHQGECISYIQYLTTDEWLNKRRIIIERDNHTCTKCKKGATYYIKNWDSPIKYHLWNINSSTGVHAPWHIKGDNKLISADKQYHLEVHHKKYILNRLPWDYKNDDLTTLCNHCHTDFHKNNKVPVFNEDELVELEYEVCSKCNGTGYIPQYNHVQGGVCFQCKGERYLQPLINRTDR